MDARVKLKSNITTIGSVSDFTFKWAINSGLNKKNAARLALAVNELVTDIVLFAFPYEEGEFEIVFRQRRSNLEVIVHEFGEPFDQDRHQYDPQRALETGNFEGAGFEIIRHMADEFVFLNKGKAGKEFRIVKNISSPHIAEIIKKEPASKEPKSATKSDYTYTPVTVEHSEVIAKLIYRTYGYTYMKEEMYYPRKIELAIERGEKFGVIVHTSINEPVGYFAVLKTTDSKIGEVGEVVVTAAHRRRGLMTKMLYQLIEMSKVKELLGLFGEAVTVHEISQRVNAKFNFRSTALLLSLFPVVKYKELEERYPQNISIVLDFLPLVAVDTADRFLPAEYKDILIEIYASLGIEVHDISVDEVPYPSKSELEINIQYEYNYSVVIVKDYGQDFKERILQACQNFKAKKMSCLNIDLPLDHPATKVVIPSLKELGFVFAGLMPMFHSEKDYLRLQVIFIPVDLKLVQVYSDMARKIKAKIALEINGL